MLLREIPQTKTAQSAPRASSITVTISFDKCECYGATGLLTAQTAFHLHTNTLKIKAVDLQGQADTRTHTLYFSFKR